MMVQRSTALFLSFSTMFAMADVCKPVSLTMTRASGSEATFANGTWSTEFGLSSVNTASLYGALKFIMTETIDTHTGYTNDTLDGCHRKNWVSYIHFYKFTICNSDEALWWFNQREAGYGGDKEAYNYGEYGQYVTFDSGQCHHNDYCDYFHGLNKRSVLGPYVGWQNNSDDVRNPTDESYWYSLPGECSEKPWGEKSDACVAAQPSGRCEDGQEPDGETCTWKYEMLGQVELDDLVGITAITNPATSEPFQNASEYCLAGNIEFERDNETYEFVQGLDFWKDPLDRAANKARVDTLLEKYAAGANNIALPESATLKTGNPRCYTNRPNCFASGEETCTRDIEQLCVECDAVDGGCEAVSDASAAFDSTQLSQVEVPEGGGETHDSSEEDDDASSSSSTLSLNSILLISMAVYLFITKQ